MDCEWMERALQQAREAYRNGEVPIGAIVVSETGELLAQSHNRVCARSDPTAHAEIVALRQAGRKLGNHRVLGARLYVTVQPCLMCLGAILHARLSELIFASPVGRAWPCLNYEDQARILRFWRDAPDLEGFKGFPEGLEDQASAFSIGRLQIRQGPLGEVAQGLMRRFFEERRRVQSRLGAAGAGAEAVAG